MSLQPVSFRYIDEYKTMNKLEGNRLYYGFIAQDFKKVFPDDVTVSKNTSYGDIHDILQLDVSSIQPHI